MNRIRRLATLIAAVPAALLLALGLSGTANAADVSANVDVDVASVAIDASLFLSDRNVKTDITPVSWER